MSRRSGPRVIYYEVDLDSRLVVRATVKKRYRILESFLSPTWSPVHRMIVRRKFDREAHDSLFMEMKMKFIKASLARAAGMGPDAPPRDPDFANQHPALCEFMTLTRVDAKTVRKTATLNVFFEQGVFKAFLNDRETRKSLCVVSDTFLGLLVALEASITSDDPGWRNLPDHNPGIPGKKK